MVDTFGSVVIQENIQDVKLTLIAELVQSWFLDVAVVHVRGAVSEVETGLTLFW